MSNEASRDLDGTSDESIGRPAQWREGRYEMAGSRVDESVMKRPGEAPPDTISRTVTQKDYQGA